MKIGIEDYHRVAKSCVRFNKRGILEWYIKSLHTLENFSSFRLVKAINKINQDVANEFLKIHKKLKEENDVK